MANQVTTNLHANQPHGLPEIALLAPQPMPAHLLTAADYAQAAHALGCAEAAIRAVSTVETGPQGAFDTLGRPTILFERHLFSKATHGAFDASAPDISNPLPGGYGPYAAQYPKILRAAALNPAAALASASWGMFQILGQNHASAGFATVDAFVAAMRSGVSAHLQAFVSFLKSDPVKLNALRTLNWPAFAARYNGTDYAASGYHLKLAAAYAANA